MKIRASVGVALGLMTGLCGAQTIEYPETRRQDVVDVYFGVEVHDPYRWLEDDNSPEVKDWVQRQNAVTMPYLHSLEGRERIKDRLTRLWNYERYGLPREEGGRYFFTKNDGLQDQSVVYMADSLRSEPQVLLDPNQWSEDGTISLGGWSVSDDGRFVAYALSDGGSDWRTVKVRDIARGEDLPDTLEWVKFSGMSWTKDGNGFYYSRYDAPKPGDELDGVNKFQKLYYHRIGTPQSEDQLIYARDDQPDWGFGGSVSDDGRYLIVGVWKGTFQENNVAYLDHEHPEQGVRDLFTGFKASYDFIGNEGPVMFFSTTDEAPKGRVIAVDTRHGNRVREIIPQSEDVLRGVSLVGGRLICQYLKDARTVVKVFETDGTYVRDVEFPTIGTASGFGGHADDPETFYAFTSFTYPTTIYRYDVQTGESEIVFQPEVEFDPARYITKQVFYRSKDGTRIPMFITHRKGIELDGDNPTLLYGYGGFNISLTPGFSVSRLVWLEMGGVYAVPNLRGGGEYGKEWHEAGITTKKQNVFDDFIAAAEYLIDEGYTSSPRLAINGGSNGGLLVGACMTQRPELYGAAIPQVGVLDMIRYDLFTIGWAWRSDYGYPSKNREDFFANLRYSPYHNVREGMCYPATLITTADHDDRVVPAHSFKFAAALQHAQSRSPDCGNPILIRIETRAGHGAGTPISKSIEQIADQYAFLVRHLDMDLPEDF